MINCSQSEDTLFFSDAVIHPLALQTWPEGRDNDFPSYCGLPQSEYPSMTISNITIPEANLQWLTRAAWYRDHSKWAVAAEHVLVCTSSSQGQKHPL